MAPIAGDRAGSPFHPGEQAVQARVGVRERIEQIGRRILRDYMPEEHREFFEDLPFLVVASQDQDGGVWASLLAGEAGFVSAPDAHRLLVRAQPFPSDPLARNLAAGAALGVLGIELATRRRNRANGHVSRVTESGFELGVEQSFGNCKQYIQARAGRIVHPGTPSAEQAVLSSDALSLLSRADTSFIASSSRDVARGYAEGLDVSHRGGRPGFIRAQREDGATRLTLPDFSGNLLFNTNGNLEVNPRAGFLALDFESGGLLSLTGAARVIWDGPELAAFQGAERLLEFRAERGWLWRGVFRDWSPAEPSPHLRGTGVWP